MSTPINFRDFGGQRTASGHHVRRDRLYRSGHLGWLHPASIQAMLNLDFACVVDLRYREEREEHASPWPRGRAERVIFHDSVTDEDAPHLRIMRTAAADLTAIDTAYCAFYAALPFDPNYRPLFATALDRMARTGGRTLLHCSAGKDRTGTLAAMILSVLGVDDAAVIDDYLRSNEGSGMEQLREHVRNRYTPSRGSSDEGHITALVGVKPAYIAAALAAVRESHGSIARYFAAGGVTAETFDRLRAAYLAGGDV